MTHFGINTHEKDNVKYRKKTTCNILPQEGRTIVRNMTYWGDGMLGTRVPLPQEEGIGYRYGNLSGNVSHPEDTDVHSLATGNVTDTYTIV